MSRSRLSFLFTVPVIALMACGSPSTGTAGTATPDAVAVAETRMALRDLWVEHVFWIRSYVMASQAHDPAQARIAEQEVVANAKALAGTITPFYGEAASGKLLALLAGHWGAVRDYHTATLAGSRAGKDKATTNLIDNAREIARFLAGANPNLPEQAVFGLLSAHGAHHMAQINEIGAGDFAAEAKTWHAMRQHMLVISDAIANAIARQFPDRFEGRS